MCEADCEGVSEGGEYGDENQCVGDAEEDWEDGLFEWGYVGQGGAEELWV